MNAGCERNRSTTSPNSVRSDGCGSDGLVGPAGMRMSRERQCGRAHEHESARVAGIEHHAGDGGPDDGSTAGGPPASRPALSVETPAGSGSNPTTTAR